MSYLKTLRKLLPAKKAWKLFTKTLQTKLHNLNRSKAIKKHKNHHHHLLPTPPKSPKPTCWTSLPFQSRSRKIKKGGHHVNTLRYKPRHRVSKKSAPVYIDQLFIEPVLAPNQRLADSPKEKVKDGQDTSAAAGTSKGDGKSHSADDMWESLVLASPQMHGINERAEEFISRFRAEMQVQEMQDGQL